MKLIEKHFDWFLDIALSPEETKLVKKRLRIVWQVSVVLITVASLVYVWKHRTPWPALPILLVTFYVGYRIYKRSGRRCPKCSMEEIRNEQGLVIERRRNLSGGWFARKNYWREELPASEVPAWILRDHQKCIFQYICLHCSHRYEVKKPEVRSFRHRPPIFKNW